MNTGNLRTIMKQLHDWGAVEDPSGAFEVKKASSMTIYIDAWYLWYSSDVMRKCLESLAHELGLVPVLQQVAWNECVPEWGVEEKQKRAVRILRAQIETATELLNG